MDQMKQDLREFVENLAANEGMLASFKKAGLYKGIGKQGAAAAKSAAGVNLKNMVATTQKQASFMRKPLMAASSGILGKR